MANFTNKETDTIFQHSSVETPSFARITILDYKHDYYGYDNDRNVPVWQGLVACEGTQKVNIEENKYWTRTAEVASFRALEEGKSLNNDIASNRRIEPPKALLLEGSEVIVNKILPVTPELMKQYNDVRDQISMTLHAYVFPDFKAPASPVTNKDSISYKDSYAVRMECMEAMNNPLVKHTYTIKGIDDQEEAQKWLLQNHPEEALAFVYSTTTGNFNLQPSLDFLSPEGFLATRNEREEYIKGLAKEMGVDIPKFDYREADKELARRNGEKEVAAWTPPTKEEKAKARGDDLDR